MQKPKYFADTMQAQSDAGINPFAVTLLAESFAQRRAVWGDDTVVVMGWGKDEKPVYILLTSAPPRNEDFAVTPEQQAPPQPAVPPLD